MPFSAHQRYVLTDRSFAHTIKKDIHNLAVSYGFGSAKLGRLDIVTAELVSNLVKYAVPGGEILVKPLSSGPEAIHGIEIICLDHGPGMTNSSRMMQDGTSTSGSSGEGLGAIQRQSDEFDLYSVAGQGTVVLARIYLDTYKPPKMAAGKRGGMNIRTVMVAKPGETACGDGWGMVQDKDVCTVLAVDGLGHGEDAQTAAREAIQTFRMHADQPPAQLLAIIHDSIRKSRGAVGAVARIDLKTNRLSFTGIGNIAGKIFSGEGVKNLLSYNGILGHNRPATINDHLFAWSDASLLILHSDGLKSRWDISRYPDLRKHDPSITAAVLYRDYGRRTDDTLIIAGRNN